jgi:hypothetical protein
MDTENVTEDDDNSGKNDAENEIIVNVLSSYYNSLTFVEICFL